jgi:hypothetical protein
MDLEALIMTRPSPDVINGWTRQASYLFAERGRSVDLTDASTHAELETYVPAIQQGKGAKQLLWRDPVGDELRLVIPGPRSGTRNPAVKPSNSSNFGIPGSALAGSPGMTAFGRCRLVG